MPRLCVASISTHTLTWSVTLSPPLLPIAPIDFNSHAHVERDLSNGQFNSTVYISTHTLTWSVTNSNGCNVATMYDFNSHAHVERDEPIPH